MLKSMGSQRAGYDLVTEYQQKYVIQGSLVAQVVKYLLAMQKTEGSIPGLGTSIGEGHGN